MTRDLFNMTLSGLWQNDNAIQRLSFDQVLAVVDALLLALKTSGDDDIARTEHMLEKYTLALPCAFDELMRLETYIGEQRRKLDPPKTRQEFEHAAWAIAARLPDDVRRQVYSMVTALLICDLELRSREQVALVVFARAFGLSEPEAATVFGETMRELGLKAT